MTQKSKPTLAETFSHIEDPRQQHKVEHPLVNILFIIFCGVLCNAENFIEIEAFSKSEKDWFGKFLDLSNGLPSHDTLSRTLGLLDEETLQKVFVAWVGLLCGKVKGQIAIDGKKLLGTGSKLESGKDALVMVTAFAVELGLTLGQRSVEAKSNEITAIPHLLEILDLNGCVVTLDAMGCQTKIVKKIRKQGGDYIISLKENQGNLYTDTTQMFEYLVREEPSKLSYARTTSKGHGRIEVRECWTYSPQDYSEHFRTIDQWQDLKSVVMVQAQRTIGNKTEIKMRFFISSLTDEAKQQLEYIRGHWQIENSAHWVMDVALKEDAHQLKERATAKNLSILRQMVRNLLKMDKSKGSIQTKMKQCGWNATKREDILGNIFNLE